MNPQLIVQRLLNYCIALRDGGAKELDQELTRSELLRHSILKWAFEWRLDKQV